VVRQEFIVVGCVPVVVGSAICIVGYNKAQPTATDSAISFLERLSGEEAPAELKTDKSGGYALIGGGLLCLAAGIGFILKSRTGLTATNEHDKEDSG